METIFTHLDARITEEDDAFKVSISIRGDSVLQEKGWGEETASSIEIASEMISEVATRYAISQECITIHLVMANISDGTRH